MALSKTRTNAVPGIRGRELNNNMMISVIRSPSVMPSISWLAHGNRLCFPFMLRDSGLMLERSIPFAPTGTARYFSSSTILSFNRFSAAPQMIRSRAALPVGAARTNYLSRNASSSGKGDKNEKDFFAETSKSKDSSGINPDNKIQEFMDTTVKNVRTNVGSAEATIKRAVEELSTGDLLSVYGIVFLIVLISLGPSMVRRMQKYHRDDNHYDDIDPEDPVMDLARMIRGEYLELIKRSRGNETKENEEVAEDDNEKISGGTLGLDRIVADLLHSPQIQEAATSLVTRIIQSSQFKTACQLLLKELLKDLLDDPDTLKQVIHLLQNAIKDEKIKEAAVQLATDIFGDDRVLDELVILVQRLGMEQQVQFATQALLVESAHNALNDPEILDHSMEFATDVVGDDVVQQTAGEALYNTMSYAFRPTLSVCKYNLDPRIFLEKKDDYGSMAFFYTKALTILFSLRLYQYSVDVVGVRLDIYLPDCFSKCKPSPKRCSGSCVFECRRENDTTIVKTCNASLRFLNCLQGRFGEHNFVPIQDDLIGRVSGWKARTDIIGICPRFIPLVAISAGTNSVIFIVRIKTDVSDHLCKVNGSTESIGVCSGHVVYWPFLRKVKVQIVLLIS